MELNANYLCYTRTFNADYRWVLIDRELTSEDILNISSDFNKISTITEKRFVDNIFFRKITTGFAIYSYNKTEKKNRDGNLIYALCGLTIKGNNCVNFYKILSLIMADFIYDMPNYNNINDKDEKLHIEFNVKFDNLRTILSSDRTRKYIRKRKVRNAIDEFLLDSEYESGFLVLDNRGEIKVEPLSKKLIRAPHNQSKNLSLWQRIGLKRK